MKKLVCAALCLALFALVIPFEVGAVEAPHVTTCSSCHNSSLPGDSITFNDNCLTCHNDFSSGTNSATKQTSHRWTGSVANPAVGAQPPATGSLSQVQNYTNSQLACVNCHNPHTNGSPMGNGKYQRVANDNDQLCLDCHRSRNVQTAATGSHPVLIGYSSAAKAAPLKFVGKVPLNANPANPTSDLGANLSHDGKLLCSTCHGVHSADSRSSNYDVAKGFKNISSGDGNLLRTNPRGAKVAAGVADKMNICTNCHAGKKSHNGKGQDIQCLDCHGAHVEYDPNDPSGSKGTNINLIRRNLPGTSNQILFRHTGDNREYKNAAGTGVCQGCHAVPATVAQHASNDPNVCNGCHNHNNATSSFSASMPDHMATLGSGDIVMFTSDSTHDVTPLSINENCSLCHYASLVQQHQGNCSLCHSGANPPRNSITGAWNKSCQQASCHPSIHTEMRPDHNGIYWNSSASCAICHDSSSEWPGPADSCTQCHNPDLTVAAVGDHQPPVTTSNALAAYIGKAVIKLMALDTDSGVSLTWINLNGRGWSIGSDITVSAPASGSRTHTLQFYSVDHGMNVEGVKSVTFTVSAASDTTPPITIPTPLPAAGAIFKTNLAVTLAATDNIGGSGVKSTYYKIDTGSFTPGTSFTVSGDGLHTFSYYSVDNANISESIHVSNTFRIDTLAPVTSNSAVNNASYTGAKTFTLTATDSGSGVAGTWYKLDNGAFTPGTSISIAAPASGSVTHGISWYSVDHAGNQEVTQSVTFSVAAVAISGTTTMSFRTNADFGGWSYVTWEVHDSNGNIVNDINGEPCTWWNDDPGHPQSMWMDFVVPSGTEYFLYGAWGPMPDGPDVDTGTRMVTASEAAPGATIVWWWN